MRLVITVFLFVFDLPAHGAGAEWEEFVKIERLSRNVNRTKRSTGLTFPHEIDFRFHLQAGEVNFRLQRSVSSAVVTPMFVLERDIKIRLHSNKTQGKFGVYQDTSLGASVIVRCPNTDADNYRLFGAFVHNNGHYQIEPAEGAGEQGTLHRVRRQVLPPGDFIGDELMPPAEGAWLNGQTSGPYPGQSVGRTDSEHPPMVLLQQEALSNRVPVPTTEPYESDVLLPGKRRRRQAEEVLYIEYMVVIDYRNLDRWKAKVGGDTEQERENNAFDAMHEFYTFVVNGIDVRFRTATAHGPEIRVALASLLVSTEEATSPWIQNNKLSSNTVDDAGVLLDFATWKNSVNQYLPRHDHAGLFTGFDIATPSSTNPIGMGYLNSICHSSWGVSEIEETYNAVSIHIAAHELGHNMGTRHDGHGTGCASSSLYLMAPRLPIITDPSIRTNPWTFSSCSQTAMKTFIDNMDSGNNCLTNVPAGASLTAMYPGRTYSADQQCNMTYGGDAVLCRDNLHSQWDSVCYGMQCKRKADSSCTGRFFPFDGTPCGDRKWCVSGLCVSSEDAPSKDENCVFGDDPNEDCTQDDACNENNFYKSQVRCCQTCLDQSDTTESSSRAPTFPSTTSHLPTSSVSSSSQSVTSSATVDISSTMSTESQTDSATPTSTASTAETTTTSPETSSTTLSSKTVITSSTPFVSSSIRSTMSESPTVSTTSDVPSSLPTKSSSLSSDFPSSSTPSSTVSTSVSSERTTLQSTLSTPPTPTPKSKLSFDVQTMISLYLSAAVVI